MPCGCSLLFRDKRIRCRAHYPHVKLCRIADKTCDVWRANGRQVLIGCRSARSNLISTRRDPDASSTGRLRGISTSTALRAHTLTVPTPTSSMARVRSSSELDEDESGEDGYAAQSSRNAKRARTDDVSQVRFRTVLCYMKPILTKFRRHLMILFCPTVTVHSLAR